MAQLTKQNNNRVLPITALLTGATIWGIIWYPYRLLNLAGINTIVATTIAFTFALLLGLLLFRKSLRCAHLFNDQAYLLFWIALFSGISNLAYIVGVVTGEVMRVLLLFYLAPLWTIGFSRILLNEQLSPHGFFVIVLSIFGAIIILWTPGSIFPLPSSLSDWMGLIGGITFALVNVLIRKDQSHNIQLKSIAIWTGITFIGLICSQLFNITFALTEISLNAWLILSGIGLMMFLSSLVLQYGLTYTPANQAIIILLFELIVASISAYMLANESMAPLEWAGALMIITATLFSTKMNRKPY